MEDLNLFPTLITKITDFINAEECAEIIKICMHEDMQQHSAINGNGVSSHNRLNKNILDNISIEIKDRLIKYLNEYKEKTGISFDKLDNSWVSIQKKGSRLYKHTHPFSSISGVFYLKVDELSSPIYFYNPNPFISFTPIIKNTEYTQSQIKVSPKIGDLLLFPSWISHGSDDAENGSNERIIISFNTIA